MKISAITLLFSAVMVPFAAVSANVYKCNAAANFHGKDATNNPHVPSKSSLDWIAGDLMQTFTVSYETNTDMNMISDRFAKFSMKRERDPNAEDIDANATSVSFMDRAVSKLRGGNDDLGKGWKKQSYYWYKYYSYVGITCRWCRDDDDYVSATNGYDTIEEALAMTREHKLWESSFCSSLQATDEFHTSFKCEINLENCVPESPNDSANGKDGADNYIVSDLRKAIKDEDEGLIYTLETMEHQVAEQSLLAE